MPTERKQTPLVKVTCTHTCPDGMHQIQWNEGSQVAITFTISIPCTFKYGPYCHFCGEYLEEDTNGTQDS